jgi:hypothetical protein
MDFKKHTKRIVNRIGEPMQYTPVVGSAFEVTASFNTPAKDALEMESFAPSVTLNYEDVPTIKNGDLFAIGSEQYKVIGKEIDRVTGLVTASLEKQ